MARAERGIPVIGRRADGMRFDQKGAGRRLRNAGMALAICGAVAGCVVAPPPGPRWIAGYYGPGGAWHPGHWSNGYGGPPLEAVEPPGGYGAGRVWVPGEYGPGGAWHPGHWAPG